MKNFIKTLAPLGAGVIILLIPLSSLLYQYYGYYASNFSKERVISKTPTIELPSSILPERHYDGYQAPWPGVIEAKSPSGIYSLRANTGDKTRISFELTNTETQEKKTVSFIGRSIDTFGYENNFNFHWINDSNILVYQRSLEHPLEKASVIWNFNLEANKAKEILIIYLSEFSQKDWIHFSSTIPALWIRDNEGVLTMIDPLTGTSKIVMTLDQLRHKGNAVTIWAHKRDFFITFDQYGFNGIYIVDPLSGQQKFIPTNLEIRNVYYYSLSPNDNKVLIGDIIYDFEKNIFIDIAKINEKLGISATPSWQDDDHLILKSRVGENEYLIQLDVNTLNYRRIILK